MGRSDEANPFGIQSSVRSFGFKCHDKMAWSTALSLIVLIASSAIECAKPFKKSEICPCVPLNICPEISRFNENDAKYFATVLRCTEEGFVRCCPDSENVNSALRRSDDAENLILTDDLSLANPFEEPTSEANDMTTVESEARSIDELTTTESLEVDSTTEELATTEQPMPEEASDEKRKSKLIDNGISVIYPNHKYPKMGKKKEIMEHLFLIFPNGEIEAALATSTADPSQNPTDRPKRVIVRKRLITKTSEAFEGAESKISQAVIEPQQMDIEDVKKRLSAMLRHNRRKNDLSTTTDSAIEETTTKKPRRKIKYRKQKETTTALPLTTKSALKASKEKVEESTMKPRRKLIYDTRSRTNFLRRPSSQQAAEDDEQIEPEVTTSAITTTTRKPEESTIRFPKPAISAPLKPASHHMNRIEVEHRAMIETVHKTLSAIHSGVDMKYVEQMLESHKKNLKEMRKSPSTTTAVPITTPTRPFRGRAKFNRPMTVAPTFDPTPAHAPRTRTRNLSRTRNTVTTQTTPATHKPVRKSPRTFVSQANPIMNSNSVLEEVDMPPKLKAPLEFKASPLYGLTMDKFNEFDHDMIEKIHETFQPQSDIQNGFFPVIQNGTPSTLL